MTAIDSEYTSNPLLATKLFIPRQRSAIIHRNRLTSALENGLDSKLTLVCAPAGFGKTTLLVDWISRGNRPAAWVSLDQTESDPICFIQYVTGALKRIQKNIGERTISMIHAVKGISAEAIAMNLVSELLEINIDFSLVLDDFHVIDNQGVYKIVKRLLDNMPDNMHLVISTRIDPPFPVSRMKVRNQITEIRTSDLCFTEDEIAAFCKDIMALKLENRDISILESKTEGWIAGLQLAALSIQGQSDIPAFIDDFAGNDRYIVDYLVEEVLSLQPAEVHDFLLQTSILNRLSASLCNFVLDQKDTQNILDGMERANLFIIPLDTKRQWYRYHHLFADLLRQRLNHTLPDRLNRLHLKASQWFELNGFKEDAVEHALAANEFERAADLIEAHIHTKWQGGEQVTLLKWLNALPDEFKISRPYLGIYYARVVFQGGRQKEAETLIDQLENAHFHSEGKDNFALIGRIAAIKAYLATRKADIPTITRYAGRALNYLSDDDYFWRSIVESSLAVAHDLKGESITAIKAHERAKETAKKAGNVYMYLIERLWIALALRGTGQLSEAMRMCRQLLKEIDDNTLDFTIAVGHIKGVWGEMLYEQNRLDEAYEHLRKGVELLEQGHDVSHLGWRYCALMKVLCSKKELAEAEKLIPKMDKLMQNSFIAPWIITHFRAIKGQILFMQGRMNDLEKWVKACGLRVDGEPRWTNAAEFIMFSRVLIAQSRFDDALTLLNRLLEENGDAGRVLEQMECLVSKSVVLKHMNHIADAVNTITHAMELAQPGGYIRVFVDQGELLAELIESMGDFGKKPVQEFAKKLLTEFKTINYVTRQGGLIEELSERELEVLRLICAGLSNKQITDELFISANTVKTHLKNIYGKLCVHSRAETILKVRELELLSF